MVELPGEIVIATAYVTAALRTVCVTIPTGVGAMMIAALTVTASVKLRSMGVVMSLGAV